MARRRRHYGDLVSFPAVGSLKDYNPLGRSVNSTDVLVGAGIGMAGGVLVRKGINFAIDKLNMSPTSPFTNFLNDYSSPIATFLAGAAAAMVFRKKSAARATGYLVGATLAAAVPLGWTLIAKTGFAGLVDVNYGLLTQENDLAGLLVDDPSMAGLAAYSEPDDVDILDAA
jgi:hypothetical protein